MSVKPFSPTDARAAKRTALPPFVLEAVNELLAENYHASSFTIRQGTIVRRIKEKMFILGMAEDEFDFKWLDFEPIYEDEGWKIVYDKPAYNETYEANFTFTPKKEQRRD